VVLELSDDDPCADPSNVALWIEAAMSNCLISVDATVYTSTADLLADNVLDALADSAAIPPRFHL